MFDFLENIERIFKINCDITTQDYSNKPKVDLKKHFHKNTLISNKVSFSKQTQKFICYINIKKLKTLAQYCESTKGVIFVASLNCYDEMVTSYRDCEYLNYDPNTNSNNSNNNNHNRRNRGNNRFHYHCTVEVIQISTSDNSTSMTGTTEMTATSTQTEKTTINAMRRQLECFDSICNHLFGHELYSILLLTRVKLSWESLVLYHEHHQVQLNM